MEKKKILILYGRPGMGHLVTANALMAVISKKYPEVEIESADAFDFLYGPLRYGYPYFYNHVVANVPFLFRMLYDGYNNKIIQKALEQITLLFVKKTQFISFVKDFSPDFILSTNPLPLQLVALMEEKNIINILSANVCTDFGFHSLWHSPEINYYFVANEEIKKSLLDHKVNLDKIKITGIPVRPVFNRPLNRQEILDDLNFDSSQPVLLIVGGQLKYKELLRVILGIKKKNNSVQFIVIAGRDKKLQKKLEKSELKKEKNIKIFGMVSDMEKFMTASDLILSKAGGSTTAECLVKCLPMIVYRAIAGQEEDNVDYLVKNNAGVKARNIKEIISVTINLFSQPKKLAEMKANCLRIQKPSASEEIVDFVVSKIK